MSKRPIVFFSGLKSVDRLKPGNRRTDYKEINWRNIRLYYVFYFQTDSNKEPSKISTIL